MLPINYYQRINKTWWVQETILELMKYLFLTVSINDTLFQKIKPTGEALPVGKVLWGAPHGPSSPVKKS